MAEEKKTTKKVNTTDSVKQGKKVTMAELDQDMKDAAKVLGEHKKVKVTIPAFLEKRLGKNVPVGINGAVIHVPVGEEVSIPEPYAKLLNQSINQLKL